MEIAKVISLSVRPFQVSHLCFEVGGILGETNVELGASVSAFDFAAFHAILGGTPTIAGHPARLLYNFLEIQTATRPFALAALRSEPAKASLSKAINARANAYYAKYANAPAIIAKMNEYYSPMFQQSKPFRLDRLADFSEQQMQLLNQAYRNDPRGVVVQTTQSVIEPNPMSEEDPSNQITNEVTVDFGTRSMNFVPPVPGDQLTLGGSGPIDQHLDAERKVTEHYRMSKSRASAQTITNTGYDYRVPSLENLAQYERAQISLIDERFSQFMSGQNLPFLAATFQNELSSIDSDVFRLQIGFLNTILLSPISGTVTGVYKNPGDAVRAGEPVIRVENNADILLLGTFKFSHRISIGSNVTIRTTLFDTPGAPKTPINGRVVAVRGQGDDDQWEVIVKCKNLAGGAPVFPLGYHFDYDDTTVEIS